MKKICALFFFIIPITLFSQQLHYGSGGTVLGSQDKKLTPIMVRELMVKNQKALALYNAGRSKKTIGNILFYGGLGLVATNVIVAANTDNTSYNSNPNGAVSVNSEKSSGTLVIIGGLLIGTSIPVKIGYPKKIKKAIELYNSNISSNYFPTQKVTIIASNQAVGIRLEW